MKGLNMLAIFSKEKKTERGLTFMAMAEYGKANGKIIDKMDMGVIKTQKGTLLKDTGWTG
jgi:hypothetical protein